MTGDDVAVQALAFFGEPLDERGRVGDLAARLRQRFALLGGHDDGQVFLVRHHEVEPACASVGRARAAVFFAQAAMRGMRRIDGAARLGRAHVRHRAEQLAVGRVADLGS